MTSPLVIALLAGSLRDNGGPEFPTIHRTVLPLFDHFKNAAESPFHKLWPLVQIMFEAIPGHFTLIVDALQDCNNRDRSGYLSKRLTDLSPLTDVRVILLFRSHTALSDPLEDAYKAAMDLAVARPDISHYVDRKILPKRKIYKYIHYSHYGSQY